MCVTKGHKDNGDAEASDPCKAFPDRGEPCDNTTHTHRELCVVLSFVSRRSETRRLFREHGVLRTREALELGIHPETLYQMRDEGELEQLTRGVYRLADAPPLAHPELVAVAARAPQAVVCLISALALFDLTSQVPHEVDIAVRRGGTRPRFSDFRVRVYTFHEKAFRAGVMEMTARNPRGMTVSERGDDRRKSPWDDYAASRSPDKESLWENPLGNPRGQEAQSITLRLYNPEKTLADVFRYRNQLGLEVFLEALEFYRQRRGASAQRVLEYARLWRTAKSIRPYLEQAFS